MLPRRILRVKSFQQVYAFELNQEANTSQFITQLKENIQNIHRAYTFHLYSLYKICEKVKDDKIVRNEKYFKTEDDRHFTIRLFRNPFIQLLEKSVYLDPSPVAPKKTKLSGNPDFLKLCNNYNFDLIWEPEQIQLFYNELKGFQFFLEYSDSRNYNIATTELTESDNLTEIYNNDEWEKEKKIIDIIYNNILVKSDLFTNKLDDHFLTWQDDKSIVTNTVLDMLELFFNKKTMPAQGELLKGIDMEENAKFAGDLFLKTNDLRTKVNEMMEPVIHNWDMERLNIVDNILIRMALTEILEFPHIPIKVSINEYLEIAKIYSTPKSKDFVNGVLDKLMKQLRDKGELHKIDPDPKI